MTEVPAPVVSTHPWPAIEGYRPLLPRLVSSHLAAPFLFVRFAPHYWSPTFSPLAVSPVEVFPESPRKRLDQPQQPEPFCATLCWDTVPLWWSVCQASLRRRREGNDPPSTPMPGLAGFELRRCVLLGGSGCQNDLSRHGNSNEMGTGQRDNIYAAPPPWVCPSFLCVICSRPGQTWHAHASIGVSKSWIDYGVPQNTVRSRAGPHSTRTDWRSGCRVRVRVGAHVQVSDSDLSRTPSLVCDVCPR